MALKNVNIVLNEIHAATTHALRDSFICDRIIAELRSHERYSKEEHARLRRRFLLRTLAVATRRIPFYRNITLSCGEADVEKFLVNEFPILEKKDYLNKREQLYPNHGKIRPWTIVGETGGTTGSPLKIIRSLSSVIWQNAFLKRQWTWSGFRDGMPRATLRGDMVVPVEQREPPYWIKNRYANQLIMSSAHLRDETADYFIDKLSEVSPYLLEAYPSAAYDLAKYLERRNRYLSIPYIFTGSELLYDYQRELIKNRFRGKVMDHYGMGERVAFATECELGNLHVNTDHSYMEIVDDEGNPTNEYGYVVGTTFHNLVMPLVRYRLSDQAKWKNGSCACGRSYPMIERVRGRIEDIILGSDGNDIGPLLFRVPNGIDGIERMQIAQVERYRLEIRVVPIAGFSEKDKELLIHNLHEHVDPGLAASVTIMDDIPRTIRGKYRWIVNEYIDGER
jgi:phenylacetate-CoA ligase